MDNSHDYDDNQKRTYLQTMNRFLEPISKAMKILFENRTVIIIAHRLQTVKHADDIIVLEEWKIIERWNHLELIEQSWSYAKMLELQSWF